MRVYTLRRRQFIPRPIDRVFAFFQAPENLGKITPSSMRFTILTPLPFSIHKGRLIDYIIRLSGVPMHWRTLISEYQPPNMFVDEQLKGPYLMWHHTHAFMEVGGGTMMTDRVRYVLPFGIIGDLVHRIYIRKQLEYIFDYRREVLARLFGG